MEEVRQLVQEEGREARNLVAFHVAVDSPARVSRKPPRCLGGPLVRRAPPRTARRSASAGRDKRSELRARYWALLFGDLQRAIGELYNTVEAHENLNECQEVILVLENYTRDFKALGEWFRLKWAYDNTPPPQRPQSLAWEIRKTDFVRPESRRAYSVKSSPSVSGKNSPCLSGHNTPSGKNSPNLTGKASPGSGKISPRITSGHSSPKATVEFFSNKVASTKIAAKPEAKMAIEPSRLSDITEKEVKENIEEVADITPPVQKEGEKREGKATSTVEIGKAKECPNNSPKQVIVKSPKKIQSREKSSGSEPQKSNSGQAKLLVDKLDTMESEFLNKQLVDSKVKNENILNQDKEIENESKEIKKEKSLSKSALSVEVSKFQPVKEEKSLFIEEKELSSSESPTKSEDNFADISNESSKSIDEKIFDSVDVMPKVIDISESKSEPENNVNSKILLDSGSSKYVEEQKVAKDTNNKVCGEDLPTKVTESKESSETVEDLKKEADKKDTKASETKITIRPAYSQAAAKPKPVSAPKTEVKTPTKTTLTRSKTVVEIRPPSGPKPQRPFAKRNQSVNKCSYPFNLTTGRTSLFDAPSAQNKSSLPKKPMTKNPQIGSGDSKPSQNKVDLKKRSPRPTSLNVDNEGLNKDQLNPALEKIKDCDEYSSTDTLVTQLDMTRIESSESLKTLVPEESQMFEDVANSIEVLNVDSNKNDNEGWLTVKSRRLSRESKKQSKSHWAQRFNQPSATTSLPTLNMIESPKQETKSFIDSPRNAKLDRAKSEQPQIPLQSKVVEVASVIEEQKSTPAPVKQEKVVKVADTDTRESDKKLIPIQEKVIKVSEMIAQETKKRDPAMIRQKSDVTGLRTKSSKSKALKKSGKCKDEQYANDEMLELTKNRLHSSLESLTTGLARSQESTEDAFDFDKWKAEFKSTFKYFEDDDQILNHDQILESADPSERSEIAEMTSQIEENEKKLGWALDFQAEVDQRKLCEEEDLLNRQILELQQVSDIDLDTETDDTETDAEIPCEEAAGQVDVISGGTLAASLEDRYETALAGMSWAERIDTLGALEALVARDPGRAQQLHAKLSQGIKRRGSLQDALRRLQAKQARAERQRREYQTERARRIHQLLARVEEVKVAKNQLIEEKRLRMEKRLQKAAENRDQHLKDIVRKAHDEEEKLREIAFIKQLEAENRRHDFLDQCRSHTTRLRQMRRERLTKLEQKAAREAAVGARRLELEAARRRRVEALVERRRLRDARRDTLDQLRRHERHRLAKEKAEGVKSRLSALAAAAELEADALRSRIRDKQDASQMRLESHLQAIREKATGPRQASTSESQEAGCREAAEHAARAARAAGARRLRDRLRAVKKRARKVRQKLLDSGNETFIFDQISFDPAVYPPSNKLHKVLHTLLNIIAPLLEDKPDKDDKSPTDGCEGDEEKSSKKNKKSKKQPDAETEESDKKKTNKKKKEGKDDSEHNNNTDDTEDTGKKKKKKERPKLSKTESVCSSLSDTSKASGRIERKSRPVIDVPVLERTINELHRILERFELQIKTEKMMYQRVYAVKLVSQLLGVAAEREDIALQLNPKLLTTSVTIISRAAAMCSVCATYIITTAACVHAVHMLAELLEKDLSDPKELELGKQLADCLSVSLDSVLCSTRLFNEGGGTDEEDIEEERLVLVHLRSRAHTIISYLCLAGCVTRAEKAGEVREGIQTLLTVCADLCQPFESESAQERQSAMQSLRCALGTGVCGSRAEFCMLFARGAQLGAKGGEGAIFVRAARTAHLLKSLAELDHHIVQEAFGEAGWPLEFRAAVARLLSQHAPSDREMPRTTVLGPGNQRLDHTLSETMVLDLIVLVGFVVVNNPQLQETILEGWSVIKTLCTLPANWLISKVHSQALLPTLVALSERPSAAAAIASEMNMQILDDFMASPESQKIRLVQVIKQSRTKKGSGKK